MAKKSSAEKTNVIALAGSKRSNIALARSKIARAGSKIARAESKIARADCRKNFVGCARDLRQVITWMARDKTRRRTSTTLYAIVS